MNGGDAWLERLLPEQSRADQEGAHAPEPPVYRFHEVSQ